MAAAAPQRRLIEEELERLAESETLRRSPRHLRLLRYLVERRVAGDDKALREAPIALEVFRRDPATFDAQADPIVRVNIGRLRERLDAHYATVITPPAVRIVLPRGRYSPEFVSEPDALQPPSGVAVLAVRNQTGLAELDAWCNALTDRLTDGLSRAGLTRVVARKSVAKAEAATADTKSIGGLLRVALLAETRVARDLDEHLRTTLRLVGAADGAPRCIEHRTGHGRERDELADRLVDAIVLRVAEATAQPNVSSILRGALTGTQRAALDSVRLMLGRRTLASTDEAVAISERIARECPASASAWASVASAWYSRLSFLDRDIHPMVARAKEAARQALALSADEPTALRTLAILACKYDYEPATAEQMFLRALRVMPNYTSARLNFAESLWLQGRFDEALAETDLALVYDPLSPAVRMARAICLGYARRHTEARLEWAIFSASGEKSPWGLLGPGMNELYDNDLDAGEALLDECLARFPQFPAPMMARAQAYAMRGDATAAHALEVQCYARFPHYAPSDRAQIASLLRDKAAALQYVASAHASRDMRFLNLAIDPAFEWLANDADFVALLRRGGVAHWRGRPAGAPQAGPIQ